jgi:uncharacterized protein (TIGR03545 family)
MASKTKKAPKLFDVRIPEKRFQKKILRRVYTVGDRDFLLGLYVPQPDGTRLRSTEPSEQEVKRLAILAKSIARNKGLVQAPKLVILAVIIAGILVFSIFFKNAAVSKALRGGLESIFGARAEVAGLDFRPLRGSIGIDRIAVADKEAPFSNLFELGRIEVSIDTLRLLEGRVLIRNLEASDLRWGTPRQTSGALATAASAPVAGTGKQEAEEALGAEDATGRGEFLQALDVPSLVDEQTAKLASVKRIAEANARLRGLAAAWSGRLDKSRATIGSLAPRVEEVRGLDPSSLATPANAQKLAALLKDTLPQVRSLTTELTDASKGLAADMRTLEAERAALTASIETDVALLKSKLDLSSGGFKSLASSLVSRLLQRYLGAFYGYAIRGRDAAIGLIQRRGSEEKKKPLARHGRTVWFPGAVYPRFLLSSARFSIGERPGFPRLEASVQDITSDPDLVDRPISLRADGRLEGKELSLQGTIDTRSRRHTDAEVSLRADNWGVAFREGLGSLGIRSVEGTAGIRTELRLAAAGGADGEGSIALRGIAVEVDASEDPIGRAAAEALRSIPEALVEFSFAAAAGKAATVSVRTNLDQLVSKSIAAQVGKLGAQYEGKLREELSGRLAAALNENEALTSSLRELQKAAGVDLSTAGSYGQVLADAQKELEKKLKGAIPLPKLGF